MRNRAGVRITLLIILSVYIPAALQAEDLKGDYDMLLEALATNHPAFLQNEASLAAAQSGYLVSRAALRPDVDLSVPISSIGYPYIYSGSYDTDYRGLYYFSLSPGITVRQMLPTAGVLTGSIGNTVGVSNYDDISSVIYEIDEDSWTNSLSLSLGINQPLFFRGAYDATVARIEKAYTSDRLAYQSSRNKLILQAVRDYYTWKQTAYQVALIEARLQGDEETYKKVEREFELGLWTKSKVHQAKSALLQSEVDLLKARQNLDAVRRVLTALYGLELPENTDTSVSELPWNIETPADDLIQAALADNPDLNTLRNSIDIARSDIILAEKDNAGALEANLSYNYDQTLAEDADRSHSINIRLGYHASVSDGGAFRESQKQRRSLMEASVSSLQEREASVSARVHSLIAALAQGDRLEELYTLQEETARFDYESGLIDYDLGRITGKDLLDRKLALENIRLSIQANTIENNMTLLELYALTGIDIFQWLSETTRNKQ